jgi:hypothetical protein
MNDNYKRAFMHFVLVSFAMLFGIWEYVNGIISFDYFAYILISAYLLMVGIIFAFASKGD